MSTLWTLTKLVRWRVRDWASCFLPLDDEQDVYRFAESQMPIRNVVFDEGKRHRSDKKLRRRHQRKENGVNKTVTLSPWRSGDVVDIAEENGGENLSWTCVGDEEFIVFCFGEDGALDVVKDGKSEDSNSENVEFDHVEDEKGVIESRNHEGIQEEDGNHDLSKEVEIISDKRGVEEGESKHLDLEFKLSCTLRSRPHADECRHQGMVSVDSIESNHSDGSRSSFAFPVLGWERMGSPAQMPRPEEFSSRNNKQPRSMRFQCCRF